MTIALCICGYLLIVALILGTGYGILTAAVDNNILSRWETDGYEIFLISGSIMWPVGIPCALTYVLFILIKNYVHSYANRVFENMEEN